MTEAASRRSATTWSASSAAPRSSSSSPWPVRTRIVRAPTARPRRRSEPWSPTIQDPAGSNPSAAAARSTISVPGLRHAQPSSGRCGQNSIPSSVTPSAASSSDRRAWIAVELVDAEHPAADRGLVRQDDEAEPQIPELAQGVRRAGDQPELVGPEHVPDLLVDRAVAVEQDEPAAHEGLHTRPPACASTPWCRNANSANWPPSASSAERTAG